MHSKLLVIYSTFMLLLVIKLSWSPCEFYLYSVGFFFIICYLLYMCVRVCSQGETGHQIVYLFIYKGSEVKLLLGTCTYSMIILN